MGRGPYVCMADVRLCRCARRHALVSQAQASSRAIRCDSQREARQGALRTLRARAGFSMCILDLFDRRFRAKVPAKAGNEGKMPYATSDIDVGPSGKGVVADRLPELADLESGASTALEGPSSEPAGAVESHTSSAPPSPRVTAESMLRLRGAASARVMSSPWRAPALHSGPRDDADARATRLGAAAGACMAGGLLGVAVGGPVGALVGGVMGGIAGNAFAPRR